MDFDHAFDKLIDPAHEGGFQDDPRDAGNWTGGAVNQGRLLGTKYGISAASYPGEDIPNLTLERAKQIYRHDYWGPAGCDALPDALKFDVFDTAVNSGVVNAIKFLQRSVSSVDDGKIGPHTVMAVQNIDPERLLARFNGHRLDFLNDNPHLWATYGRGWSQRIAENLMAA
jgi:lysozyme family protein